MIDPNAFARLLCEWCLEPQPGQQVLVRSSTLGLPLVRAMHREVLGRGAWPLIRLSFPEQLPDFFNHAHEEQLDTFAPVELLETQAVDAVLGIDAPPDMRPMVQVEPNRIVRALRAQLPIQQARASKRWCNTQWPTPALADIAGMSEAQYATFLAGALFLDRVDPVGAWRELSERQAELVERLSTVRELRIEAEGTDLRLRVDNRKWMNSDGKRNMPSGEVFTSPHEDSANGTIRFTIPARHRAIEVRGIEVTFRDGQVVSARAQEGDDYLQATLATDEGARRLGEIGIGTNRGIDRSTGSTLLDEKMAGTVHLALGRSYPETGGSNVSALHWDLICDLRSAGRLSADGETLEVFSEL